MRSKTCDHFRCGTCVASRLRPSGPDAGGRSAPTIATVKASAAPRSSDLMGSRACSCPVATSNAAMAVTCDAVAVSAEYARTGTKSARITVREGDIEQLGDDGNQTERPLDSGRHAFVGRVRVVRVLLF